MRVNNRINDIHAGTAPLNTSLEGDGVIIGLIDTGIDFLHPDFMNPDSSTRFMIYGTKHLALTNILQLNMVMGSIGTALK